MSAKASSDARDGRENVSAAFERALGHLKQSGLRVSAPRALIVEAFFASARKVTAEQLASELRDRGVQVSVSTVYRALACLVEHRLATVHRFDRQQSRFEPAAPDGHADHLVCTSCRTAIDFVDAALAELSARIAQRHRFDVRAHAVEIYGVCEKCLRRAGGAAPA